MKKLFMIIICFIAVLIISLGLTKESCSILAATYPEWYQYDSEDFYGENTIMRIQDWHIVDLYAGHKGVRVEFNMSALYGFVPQILYISQYPIDNLYLNIYGVEAIIVVTNSQGQFITQIYLSEFGFETSLTGDIFNFYTQLPLEQRKFVPIPLHDYPESSTDNWTVAIVIPFKDEANQTTILNAMKHTFAFGSFDGVRNYMTLINTAIEEAGYNSGYNDGYNAGVSGTISVNWFTSFVNSVFDIFNIEIFPNIKFAYLLFIPVGLGVALLILKLIRG